MANVCETTLCAWCGCPLPRGKIIYHNETICYECYGKSLKDRRRVAKLQKTTKGENKLSWEDTYDAWKTTPPDNKPSLCSCEMCGCEMYPDDEYYDVNGALLCPECANDWLDSNKGYVTEEMAYDRR